MAVGKGEETVDGWSAVEIAVITMSPDAGVMLPGVNVELPELLSYTADVVRVPENAYTIMVGLVPPLPTLKV